MRFVVVSLMLCLAACRNDPAPPANTSTPTETPGAAAHGVDRSHAGTPLPDVVIKNPDDGDTKMTAMKGVPTLVNLWASWCAPCVKELPTLNALSKRYRDGGEVGFVAVSQDQAPKASVEAFLKQHGIDNLAAFRDPDMALSAAIDAQTLPTTVMYGADGKEVWRYVGDLDWTSTEAAKLIAEGAGSSAN